MNKTNNVDNGHRRHKCSICGQVRYQRYMEVIARLMYGTAKSWQVKTRYGNLCWVCVDNPDCQQKKDNLMFINFMNKYSKSWRDYNKPLKQKIKKIKEQLTMFSFIKGRSRVKV